MKNLITLLLITFTLVSKTHSQADNYNLSSKNLHKKVRKTIEHFYKYDEASGGFVKTSVNINRYNDDENLIESYSLYNSKYSESTPVKKIYNYNSDGLLMSTKDISDKRGNYSTEYKLTYDKKDNLIKSESIYKDGSKFYSVFKNDKKGRVINKKEYSKANALTADINYTYKGDTKTANRTSFSSTDGSIIGNYITTYEDGIKTAYKSESKYGKSSNTYEYDKEGNLSATNFSGKTKSRSTYDYVYDKKDNWVKHHTRSGKYQYFYFREIHFANGDVSGSVDFDKQFINRLGNFANVEVVPLKMEEKKNITNNDKNNSTNSSYLKNKTWNFEYVYLKEAVKKLSGTLALKTINDSNLKLNSDAVFTVKFSTSTFNFNLKVNSFKTLDDKYEFKLSNSNNETGLLWIYKKLKSLKDEDSGDVFKVNGLFVMKEKDGSTMSFYIK